jgi:signal transduction histidine kinase
MLYPKSQALFRAVLYGGGSVLLVFDFFFLTRATLAGNFVPIVPIVASIFTAAGLLFIVYAEYRARELDKDEHRRISRVAHQLESPVRALETDLAELLKHAATLPAEARLKLKQMETKNKVLLENIRDVFLMLQAAEESIADTVRTYDLCALVQDVVAEQQPLAAARNVTITQQLRCAAAPVRVDRRLFKIILRHLLENSLLYTLTPGLVNVVVNATKQFAQVIIQDRGVGIASADRAIVFKPFARGHKASQFDPDGIGVGLTLSRLIAREFKGDLTYKPRPHKTGSEFTLTLPLTRKK